MEVRALLTLHSCFTEFSPCSHSLPFLDQHISLSFSTLFLFGLQSTLSACVLGFQSTLCIYSLLSFSSLFGHHFLLAALFFLKSGEFIHCSFSALILQDSTDVSRLFLAVLTFQFGNLRSTSDSYRQSHSLSCVQN